MNRRLAELEMQWRQKRRQFAIDKLREKGANIEDPHGNTNENHAQLVMGNNLVFANGRLVEFDSAELDSRLVATTRIGPQRKKLSDEDLKSKIKTILESDIEKNRALVFGGKLPEGSPDVDEDPNVNLRREFRDQIRVNQVLINGHVIRHGLKSSGIVVRLAESSWKGTDEDLSLLKDISPIQEISFEDQSIASGTIKKIAELPTLQKLTLHSCNISAKDLNGPKWSHNLRQLEFVDQEVTTDLIESCAVIPSLQVLTFNACDMKGAAVNALKDLEALRGLQFNETEIDKSVFDSMGKLKQLMFVRLSVCKFRTVDYRALKSVRPKLRIDFTAQAFLGVRGPRELTPFDAEEVGDQKSGCQISEVIVGSAAHQAGMKADDVVEKVNGQAIKRFEDLRLHIAQHQAGDTLDVVVRRSGKPVKLAVKLGTPDPALVR